MKKIVSILFACIYCCFPYGLYKMISKKVVFLYSCWISNYFKHVGKGTRFERKIYTRGGNYIEIGDNCIFHKDFIIDAWDHYKGDNYTPSIVIGSNCSFGRCGQITACNKIVIGDNLLTGAFVIISDNNHGTFSDSDLKMNPRMRHLSCKGEVIIGDNVWLGDKVAVLSGVHIGDGVIVAANAVVTQDIPPYSLVGGIPAKIIKQLKKEEIYEL